MPAVPNGSVSDRLSLLALAQSAGVLAAACACLAAPALAQDRAATSARPSGSIQQTPARDGFTLNGALARLARNPRDIEALIDAGNAALGMGDADAAIGFYRRADEVSPGNARVKAGLAGAMVISGNPFGAIPLFEEAERAGAMDTSIASDRGLAYDLVGDNVTAQRYYRIALSRSGNDEARRRLALSLAIARDRLGSDTALSSLLQKQDQAAWRTRAFALAILGQTDEAVSIANTILPSEVAGGMASYLRYMPRLTPAQQAAAANFGQFPRASEIGRDDPRVAQFAAATARPGLASAEAGLIPKGEPLGRSSRNRNNRQAARDRTAPPEPMPTREVVSANAPVPDNRSLAVRPVPPPIAAPVAARVPVVASAPVKVAPMPASVTAPVPAPVTAPVIGSPFTFDPVASSAPVVAQPLPRAAPPGPSIGPLQGPELPQSAPVSRPSASPVIVQPAPAPNSAVAAPPTAPAPVPARRPSLAEVFGDLSGPSTDKGLAAGAVDIRKIKPAREGEDAKTAATKAAAAKPPPPSHPSRIWVQVATGRDRRALAFDWRRMTGKAADVFKGKQASVSAWGQTSRLLTGPFESQSAANGFLAQLRRAGVDGAFLWNSPAGQIVDALPGR